MTDSDSLRGDPNYDPTRRHHPELRELDTLRALLRPRMTEEGDPTPTDALRGMFIEIERLRTMEGRRRPMDEAIIADNENAIARLTGELAAERKLAAAAATGHDHARGLLVAIAEVFGSVDDLDSLPAKVRELSDNCLHNCNKAERVQAHIEHAKKRVAKAEAALALLGWDRAQDMTTWARSSAQPVAATRWTKICEAFGFDPEEDPPVSIPAVLAGERWTNARRMLADACKRAPSLEVALGGLVLGLSEAREAARAMGHGQTVCTGCARRIAQGEAKQPVQGCGDCWWLEFGDAPLAGFRWADPEPCSTVLPATAQAPIEAPCPKLEEPCHVRKGPESSLAGAREHHNRTVAALDAAGLPAPGRARCPICHRMAPVKDGCFQPHISGDSTCSGSAGQTGLLRAWREWIIVKDAGLHGGLFDSELRAKFDEHATEARRLTDERLDALQKHVGDLAEALNEKTAALDAIPAQLAALKDTADAAHAAMRRLGWDGSTYPDEWAIACALSNVHRTAELRTLREKVGVLEAQLAAAGEDTDEIEAVREAIGVPAGKPLMSYVVHAAAGMQALAILGWQDGHPVEWATKRAAAEADLRGVQNEKLIGLVDVLRSIKHQLLSLADLSP